jgi:hypothetical protein
MLFLKLRGGAGEGPPPPGGVWQQRGPGDHLCVCAASTICVYCMYTYVCMYIYMFRNLRHTPRTTSCTVICSAFWTHFARCTENRCLQDEFHIAKTVHVVLHERRFPLPVPARCQRAGCTRSRSRPARPPAAWLRPGACPTYLSSVTCAIYSATGRL